LAETVILDYFQYPKNKIPETFCLYLLFLNGAFKCRKVVIHIAVMYFFITKHGENRVFLGQIIEIFKWSPFIMLISHKCNQTTP